jgi:hypothetical protein
MLPEPGQIRALTALLTVRSLPDFLVRVWLSLILAIYLLIRPSVISALGPARWMMSVLLPFILLGMVWVTFVVLVRRHEHLFAEAPPPRARRAASTGRRAE